MSCHKLFECPDPGPPPTYLPLSYLFCWNRSYLHYQVTSEPEMLMRDLCHNVPPVSSILIKLIGGLPTSFNYLDLLHVDSLASLSFSGPMHVVGCWWPANCTWVLIQTCLPLYPACRQGVVTWEPAEGDQGAHKGIHPWETQAWWWEDNWVWLHIVFGLIDRSPIFALAWG